MRRIIKRPGENSGCRISSISSLSSWWPAWQAACFRGVLCAVLGLLTACGDLPRPFAGYPGAQAVRLSQPPPARLAVVRPDNALLPDQAAAGFAKAVAEQLIQKEVPAVSMPAQKGDWRLVVSAELDAGQVTPVFTVLDPFGHDSGQTQGRKVPAAAWAAGTPATLQQAAIAAAPAIADLLTTIEAARRASDPNSLTNRPARIAVPDVTGAPGDGNLQLSRQMRQQLGKYSLQIQDSSPDFTVTGQVLTVPIAGQMQRIEIQWKVTDAGGREAGLLVQLNEVPAGSLDRNWGDVALVVAQEAAGGVKDVVLRQTGRAPPKDAPTKDTPAKDALAKPPLP